MADAVMHSVRDGEGCEVMEPTGNSCGQFLRVVQRGASNLYFPRVVSSIYLPYWEESANADIITALNDPRNWNMLKNSAAGGRIERVRCEVVAEQRELNPDDLLAAAQRKLEGEPVDSEIFAQTEMEYRFAEYEVLCQVTDSEHTDLMIREADYQDYEDLVRLHFSGIRLIHKLRETRALADFTRLVPATGPEDPRSQLLRRDHRINWLPAIVVRGEGLFFEFDSEAIERWLQLCPYIIERIESLDLTLNEQRQRGRVINPVTPKFVLLHSFAHMMINQLCFDCGYGSASLRERIYCNRHLDDRPMQGVLIYTASGDSEGSMGGLVRQGNPGFLETTLKRAIHSAGWCSSDPVCIESEGQGSDNSNLAACHGCILTSETSCEEGNRLLDRALLTGRFDETGRRNITGFFNPQVQA
ncbi:DUF1998 domain-containing protein [Verrucomicrobia bacterium]|nr:DUF1998 domain-containing protein [Verrucomicrobiota bacterium]